MTLHVICMHEHTKWLQGFLFSDWAESIRSESINLVPIRNQNGCGRLKRFPPGVLPFLKTFIVSAFSLHQTDCPWVFKDGMHAPKKSQLAQLWFLVQQPMTGKSFTLFCLKKTHTKVKPLDVILLYSHNDLAFLSQVRTSSGTRAFHYYLMVNNHRFIPSTYTHLTGGFYCSHGIQNIF